MTNYSGLMITTILLISSFCIHGFETPLRRRIVNRVTVTNNSPTNSIVMSRKSLTLTELRMKDLDGIEEEGTVSSRRTLLKNLALVVGSSSSSLLSVSSVPRVAFAEEEVVVENAVEMKTFIDPQGMFALTLPKRFFALRRTSKGDLPDSKTGVGRRGSSIFTGGDMAKAEVVAVERYASCYNYYYDHYTIYEFFFRSFQNPIKTKQN